MSTPAVYRFLPWTRRGLVAELRDSAGADNGPLPARAAVKLDVTLTGGSGTGSTTTKLAGPGDVVGIDPAEIVRVTPRPGTTDAEPNFLAAIDFDDAGLPWLMTPAAPNPQGQLRPWLVLVVVEDRPGVSIRTTAGAPLPQLVIESGAQQELPTLKDSWAWAHTQVLVAEGSGLTAAAMATDPDRHVSRLLCPRRLRPRARWHACLVPAFDAGVARGLGAVPQGDTLQPAWTDQDSITLPLYFHWDFGTGPDGDFESLARRLRPFPIGDDARVGVIPMDIGEPGGGIDLGGDPQRVVAMDGALRTLQQSDGKLSEIPAEVRDRLEPLLDEIANPPGDDPEKDAVGPPLYASWAANRFALAGAPDGWFRELNLDPRTRVAAGLGAEVVRRNQEDLMTAAWRQVGDVLAANALLSRGRLSIDASTALHAKSVAKLPPAVVLGYAAPLADRTMLRDVTVAAEIAKTSLPDAAIDPAMRRLVAPTARTVRTAVRFGRASAGTLGSSLVARLANGTDLVDPTSFVPSGIAPPADRAPKKQRGGGLDLGPLGIPVVTPKAEADAILDGVTAAQKAGGTDAAKRLVLSGTLRSTGILTTPIVDRVRALPTDIVDRERPGADLLLALQRAAQVHADTSGFVLGRAARGGAIEFAPVDISGRGTVVLRTDATRSNIVLGRIAESRSATGDLGRLPIGTVRADAEPFVVRGGTLGGQVRVTRERPRRDIDGPVLSEAEPIFTGTTVTLPPLVKDSAVITRFETAVSYLDGISGIAVAPPERRVVPYAIDQAATALTTRCLPANAHAARLDVMVRFGGHALSEVRTGAAVAGIAVAPLVDRVMAYPRIDEPVSRLLARWDRSRLLPGVDDIPPDSVTLLETNPRFIAAFMAGLNHEFARELLWRRYPTDQRGTPLRRFWEGAPGATDIPPLHTWQPAGRSLVEATGGESNLVLLVRGQLLRRYPNTVILAIRSTPAGAPSTADADVKRPIFAGVIEPDICYYGFDLEDDDITAGPGWFFAIQEQITEPRFALDETVDATRGALDAWREAAWPDTAIEAGAPFGVADLQQLARARALDPAPATAAAVAEALFQNPVQVIVHGRNLTTADD